MYHAIAKFEFSVYESGGSFSNSAPLASEYIYGSQTPKTPNSASPKRFNARLTKKELKKKTKKKKRERERNYSLWFLNKSESHCIPPFPASSAVVTMIQTKVLRKETIKRHRRDPNPGSRMLTCGSRE